MSPDSIAANRRDRRLQITSIADYRTTMDSPAHQFAASLLENEVFRAKFEEASRNVLSAEPDVNVRDDVAQDASMRIFQYLLNTGPLDWLDVSSPKFAKWAYNFSWRNLRWALLVHWRSHREPPARDVLQAQIEAIASVPKSHYDLVWAAVITAIFRLGGNLKNVMLDWLDDIAIADTAQRLNLKRTSVHVFRSQGVQALRKSLDRVLASVIC